MRAGAHHGTPEGILIRLRRTRCAAHANNAIQADLARKIRPLKVVV